MEVHLHLFATFGARFGERSASLLYRSTLSPHCIEAWADSGAHLEVLGYEVNILPSQGNET